MIRSTSCRRTALAAAMLATALLACRGDGPSEPPSIIPGPVSRIPGSYSVRDISGDITGPPSRFNDQGDLITWWQKFVSGGAAAVPPAACGAVALNNRSHVLCLVRPLTDGRTLPRNYAIWDGQSLTPLAGLDTFPSYHFYAWALNDSDAVAVSFTNAEFSNPGCMKSPQGACAAIWRNGQLTFPDLGVYGMTHVNNRLDLVLQFPAPSPGSGVAIYDWESRRVEHLGFSPTQVHDLNEAGWVVGSRNDGDRRSPKFTAFLYRPTGLTVLGSGEATGVNDAGVVVGTIDGRAVMWKEGIVSPLTFAASDTQWTVTRAMEINNRGQILAQADDSASAKLNRWVILTPISP